jgi:hypothetical protein
MKCKGCVLGRDLTSVAEGDFVCSSGNAVGVGCFVGRSVGGCSGEGDLEGEEAVGITLDCLLDGGVVGDISTCRKLKFVEYFDRYYNRVAVASYHLLLS